MQFRQLYPTYKNRNGFINKEIFILFYFLLELSSAMRIDAL